MPLFPKSHLSPLTIVLPLSVDLPHEPPVASYYMLRIAWIPYSIRNTQYVIDIWELSCPLFRFVGSVVWRSCWRFLCCRGPALGSRGGFAPARSALPALRSS